MQSRAALSYPVKGFGEATALMLSARVKPGLGHIGRAENTRFAVSPLSFGLIAGLS